MTPPLRRKKPFGVTKGFLIVRRPGLDPAALLLFLTNLFGLALGGTVVAFFTDYVYGDDLALSKSIASVSAIMYPLAAILIAWGLRHYRNILAIK